MKKVLFTILLSLIYATILVSFALPVFLKLHSNLQAEIILLILLFFISFKMGASTLEKETPYLELIGIPAVFTLTHILIFRDIGVIMFSMRYAIFEFVFFRIGVTYQTNKKEGLIHLFLVSLFLLYILVSLFIVKN